MDPSRLEMKAIYEKIMNDRKSRLMPPELSRSRVVSAADPGAHARKLRIQLTNTTLQRRQVTTTPRRSFSARSYNLTQADLTPTHIHLRALTALPRRENLYSALSRDELFSIQGDELNSARRAKTAPAPTKLLSPQTERYACEIIEQRQAQLLKQLTVMRPHRVAHNYYINGQSLAMKNKYQVNEEEIRILNELKREREKQSERRVEYLRNRSACSTGGDNAEQVDTEQPHTSRSEHENPEQTTEQKPEIIIETTQEKT